MDKKIIKKYEYVIHEQWNAILELFNKFADKKPIMLYDIQEMRIYAYPFNEFKNDLTEKSRKMIESQYEEAINNDQMVVFISDNKEEILLSYRYDI